MKRHPYPTLQQIKPNNSVTVEPSDRAILYKPSASIPCHFTGGIEDRLFTALYFLIFLFDR